MGEQRFADQPSGSTAPVELAGIVEGFFEVLRAGSEMLGAEHLYPLIGSDADGALDGEGVAGNGESVIRTALPEQVESTTQVFGLDEWCGGVNTAGKIDRASVVLHPVDGVSNDRDGAGVVI